MAGQEILAPQSQYSVPKPIGSDDGVRTQRSTVRRRRGQSGAALVEFALIAPLLFAIVLGMVDFGVGYNDWIALRQGTRDGARQAVTGRVGTDTSCSIRTGSPTFPANSQVNELVCLVKDRLELPEATTAIKLVIEGNYPDRRTLAVCAMTKLNSVTGLYSAVLNRIVLRTSVQMKIEQTVDQVLSNGKVLANWQEAALPGSSWTFCTVEPTT